MKRVIFLNRFFAPDHSATSQIVSDLAFSLAEFGRDVHVITSRQLYDEPLANLPAESLLNGVQVHRVFSTQYGRSALPGRAVDYISFYISLWRRVRSLSRQGDIVIPMTDPPLASVPAILAAKRRGVHFVNWLQDIYPEVAIALGVPLIKGPVGSALSYIRDRALKVADVNVVVGERMAEYVTSRGVARNHIEVIHNWTDDDEIFRRARADNPLRQQWGLEGKFVVGYSGNLGRAHEFNTVLAAGEQLRHHQDILFVFIGGGNRMGELARAAEARGLKSTFRFFPYQDRKLLRYSLALPDVHWISLKPSVEGFIVPSKFYGIAAAGRPVIAITARDGEIARLVQLYRCGIVVEPGQARLLAATLLQLSADLGSLVEMGIRSRFMLDNHFRRRKALEQWRNLLRRVEGI